MERRLKLGICRMLGLSFFSCRPRDLSDVVQEPIYISHGGRKHLQAQQEAAPLPPPPSRNFPSLCRSRKATMAVEGQCSESGSKLICPPAPPASPLNSCLKSLQQVGENPKKTKLRKPERGIKKDRKGKGNVQTMIPSTSSADSHCFFSSDEERKLETCFSPRSFSSDDSFWEGHRLRRRALRRKSRRRSGRPRKGALDRRPPSGVKSEEHVKESFAVVKRSSDPRADFRCSMVEMIMEKQIFGAAELEKLLHCFLSLNSPCHHRVILEVFEDICQVLFCNWS